MGRWRAGGTYESLGEIAFPQSLGAVYAAVTGFLGFRPNNGEGKVMGLAPYGTDRSRWGSRWTHWACNARRYSCRGCGQEGQAAQACP